MNIMRIFSHELHALPDLLLNGAKIFARNSCQFHANFMRGTFCCERDCRKYDYQAFVSVILQWSEFAVSS